MNTHADLLCADLLLPACRFTTRYGTALTILLVVVWPCLALPAKGFSKGYFTFWVILSIVWGLVATIAMIVWPVAENWGAITNTLSNLASGKRVTLDESPEFDGISQRPNDIDVSKKVGYENNAPPPLEVAPPTAPPAHV